MRFPIVRFGADDRPIARWEWCFAPIVYPVFLACLFTAALVSIPYYWLYPEHHMTRVDFRGTDRERRELRRFRLYRARVTLWRRLFERLHLMAFDGPPPRRARPTRPR